MSQILQKTWLKSEKVNFGKKHILIDPGGPDGAGGWIGVLYTCAHGAVCLGPVSDPLVVS